MEPAPRHSQTSRAKYLLPPGPAPGVCPSVAPERDYGALASFGLKRESALCMRQRQGSLLAQGVRGPPGGVHDHRLV
jgi:hypothetical protein